MVDNVDFGNLLDKSWTKFRDNFALYGSIALLFSFLPGAVYSLWVDSRAAFWNVEILPPLSEMTREFGTLMAPSILVWIFGIVTSVSVIYALNVKSGKKVEFENAIKGGSRFILPAFILGLFIMILLIPLFMLLIIPGLIFAVYWVFVTYALVIEKVSITESMRISYKIVKGDWWRVFGYMILLWLIIIAISLIPIMIFNNLGRAGIVLSTALDTLTSLFTLVFTNEFYLALRKKKVKKKSK